MNKKILVIDVGGTNVKVRLAGPQGAAEDPLGPEMTAARMAAAVKKATAAGSTTRCPSAIPGPS